MSSITTTPIIQKTMYTVSVVLVAQALRVLLSHSSPLKVCNPSSSVLKHANLLHCRFQAGVLLSCDFFLHFEEEIG